MTRFGLKLSAALAAALKHGVNASVPSVLSCFRFPLSAFRFPCIIPLLLVVLVAGCKKSIPNDTEARKAESAKAESGKPQPSPLSARPPLARLHWLGKKRLAAETNAAGFMKIWNEPESAKIEAQTLDKLALALSAEAKGQNPEIETNFPSLQHSNTPSLQSSHTPSLQYSNAPPLFRALLDDLVNQESYLEVAQPASQPGELAFAIRLDQPRAGLWETNLLVISNKWSVGGSPGSRAEGPGSKADPDERASSPLPSPPLGTEEREKRPPRHLTVLRAGEWTVVGLGGERNTLAGEFAARIQRTGLPFLPPVSNFWLEADLDLTRVASALALDWHLPDDWPKISATIIGDGENVRTHGELSFPRRLPIALETWSIPTNLVRSALISFTAARGIGPLLQKVKPFSDFRSQPVPDQIFAWDLAGLPFDLFFASPVKDAADAFLTVAPPIKEWLDSGLNPMHGFETIDTNTFTLNWEGMPFATPFLRAVTNSVPQFLFGGFGPHFSGRTNRMPAELLAHLTEGTNIVYFDWEITSTKLVHWRYLDDSARIVSDASHFPRLRPDCDSMEWIANVSTNLGYSVTDLRLADTNRLTFARKSPVGLTAFEIDVLANWLELPQFPGGFRTIFETNPTPARLVGRQRTNSVPVPPPPGP